MFDWSYLKQALEGRASIVIRVQRDWLYILISTLTLTAASSAAVFTYLQAREAGVALKQAETQFSLDQRPWIGVLDVKHTGKLRGGTTPYFSMEIENSGKSPGRILYA